MPTNVEIKAVLVDRSAVEAIVARLCDSGPEVIQQEDTFFACKGGRLKLRILAPDRGELIRYERSDVAEVRESHYSIARTSDPLILLNILTSALGKTGVVRKTRTLYMIGQTRIHLDSVKGLGDYLELEVVLRPGQSRIEGKAIADQLLAQFGIEERHLLAEAYVDLLARLAGSETSQLRGVDGGNKLAS
ncbi:MAG: class IV adenylate cyclase [Candidatus Sulfotelmatobacter sp.]